MNRQRTAELSHVVPNVFVVDVDAAADFYIGRLGFELHYRHDDDACDLAIVGRDEVIIHVCTCACDDKRHVGNAFFEVRVDDAADLFAEFQAAGVPFKWELQHHPWGMTDFTIIDPEGNWIAFASPSDDD